MTKKRIMLGAGLFLAAVILILTSGAFRPDNPQEKGLAWPLPDGCTSILVGKAASTDGSVMTTHTADCGMCDWTFHYVPPGDHAADAVRKIYHIDQIRTWPPETGGKWVMALKEGYTEVDIPQVPHTYGYVFGVFGYMNENQLAMGESSIGCRREMRNNTPTPVMDITMLTLLAMERCRTAREAIKLMGELAEKYGYGKVDSGEMLAVADKDEAWIFEIMPVGPLWTPKTGKPGAVWCAQRVPDDEVSVTPNESRIGEIDRDDPDHFLFSPNVVAFAKEKGFYDPEGGQPFNWKRAYSPAAGSAGSTQARRGRLWRFFDLVAPSKNFSPDIPNMDLPFSVKPDKKLSLTDIMAFTRDKYEGSVYDLTKGIKGGPFANPNYFKGFSVDGERYNGPRCICVNNVEYTTVTVCRDWLPDAIGGVVWLAFGAQDTACYMPLYAGITRIPESFSIGDHWEFNRKSARWAFDYVDFHTQVVYSYAIEDVKKAQLEWEDAAINKGPAIEKTAQEIFAQDPALAIEYLTDYCNNHADKVVQAWWDLGDALLVKYNHFRIYNAEKRNLGRLSYSEEWNRAVKEHDGLKPMPQQERRR